MWLRVIALTLALTLTLSAQRSAPNTRPHTSQTLTVRIALDNEQSLDSPVRVQLTNDTGATVSENFAHNGIAEFPGVREGHYRLHVTGTEIEDTTTESFTISSIEVNPLQFVHVKLRPQADQGPNAPGMVSAYDANIPDSAKAELRKGHEEIAHQEWKKAISHLEKATRIYPQYASAYNDLGVACIKSGDSARARQAFQKAADLNEHTGMAYLNLARFSVMERNYPETMRLANKSLALNPNQAEALLMLANAEVATRQFASALAHARKVHELEHQHYAVAHVIAAAALEGEQKPAAAAAEYQMFLKEDPNSPRAPAVRKALSRLSAQAPQLPSGPLPSPEH